MGFFPTNRFFFSDFQKPNKCIEKLSNISSPVQLCIIMSVNLIALSIILSFFFIDDFFCILAWCRSVGAESK